MSEGTGRLSIYRQPVPTVLLRPHGNGSRSTIHITEGAGRQDDRLLAGQDLRERKDVPSEEGGGGSGCGGQAGISYLQLATLGLSGRFSSGNISLHCPPRGDDVGIPVRMAVCRANIVSVDWISLNGIKKETNESLVDRYRALKYSRIILSSRELKIETNMVWKNLEFI